MPVAVKVTGFGVIPPGAAVAVSEFGPATLPSVHDAAVATPEALVVTAVTGSTAPPPPATANVTDTPATGLLLASRTSTAGAVVTAVPAVADCPSPTLMLIWVGAPAVMFTDDEVAAVSPALANWSVRAPTVPVMDSPANVANPAALVLIVATPPNAPPPVKIDAVTDTTAATGFPDASRTWTVGCCAKLAPLAAEADGCVTMVNWVAAPAVMPTADEVAGVTPALVNCKVRDPTVPVMAKSVKVAKPEALVLTVVVPPSVPPPEAIAAVTDTAADTGFPDASRSCTVGCCTNATPLGDDADGCCTIVSCVAVPAVRLITAVVSVVSPADEKSSVLGPTAPVSTSPVNVANPLAFVVRLKVPVRTAEPEFERTEMLRVTATGLPAASCTWTVGATGNARPLCAVVGCVTTATRAAVPAVKVIVLEVTPVTPVPVNCSV